MASRIPITSRWDSSSGQVGERWLTWMAVAAGFLTRKPGLYCLVEHRLGKATSECILLARVVAGDDSGLLVC